MNRHILLVAAPMVSMVLSLSLTVRAADPVAPVRMGCGIMTFDTQVYVLPPLSSADTARGTESRVA